MLSRIHIHLKKLWEMNLMKLKHNTRKENLRVHRNSREERKTRYELDRIYREWGIISDYDRGINGERGSRV